MKLSFMQCNCRANIQVYNDMFAVIDFNEYVETY